MGVPGGSLATAALLCAILAGACGPAAAPPPVTRPPAPDVAAAAPPTGTVLFECEPADAVVTVDGDRRGTLETVASAGGLRLPLGLHRFEISHPGYAPYRIELNIRATLERLRVKLKPIRR